MFIGAWEGGGPGDAVPGTWNSLSLSSRHLCRNNASITQFKSPNSRERVQVHPPLPKLHPGRGGRPQRDLGVLASARPTLDLFICWSFHNPELEIPCSFIQTFYYRQCQEYKTRMYLHSAPSVITVLPCYICAPSPIPTWLLLFS